MTDYQQIVDEIRFALQSEDCELTESLRQAAQDYALACREVNLQLRKVATYLDRGLRSEAIQLAEGPPNLVDVANILNLPEIEQWLDVVAIYDLPKSELLSLGVVEQLNDAMVVDQPLQKLLSKHRRLALIRAPLRMRLAVLRELLLADPETPCWDEDVRTFEKARFNEIQTAAREAQRSGDLAQLRQLQTDLAGTDWLEKPPAKVVNSLRATLADLTKSTARRELDVLAEQLEAAFSELDLAQARKLRAQWNDAKKRAAAPPGDALLQQVAPIIGWVEDEDAREAAEKKYDQLIAQFDRELEGETTVEELDRLAHEVRRLDRELPELLVIRYRNRRDALLLAQSRRHRLQFGSAIAVLLLVVGFVALLVSRQMETAAVGRLAQQIEQLLDKRQYDAARKLLEQRSDISNWDSLSELLTRLETEQQTDRDRSQRLQRELKTASEAHEYRDAISALDRAKLLVSTPEEELALEELRRDWDNRQNKMMATWEKSLREGIQAVTASLVNIDSQLEKSQFDENLNTALNRIAADVARLEAEAQGLRPEFGNQIKLLAARQQELKKLLEGGQLRAKREAELKSRAFVKLDQAEPAAATQQYHDALLAYAEALGEDRTAAQLRQTAGELQFWRAALEWSKTTSGWTEIWPRDAMEVAARTTECNDFLKSCAGAPDAAAVKTYLEQLNALTAREGIAGGATPGLKDKLLRVYSNPLIAKSWCLKTEDGRVFYVAEPMVIPAGKLINFKYYVGYGKDDFDTQKRVKEEDLVSHEATPSPSSKIAEFANGRLNTMPPEQWNEFCRDLAMQILSSEELNAYLKFDLLRRTLEASSEGDVFLREQLAPHLKLLQGAAINPLARWMNPDDPEGKKATSEAAQVLTQFRRLRDLEDAWRTADEARTAFAARLRSPAVMVGWLKPGDEWSCETEWSPEGGQYQLQITFVEPGGSISQWRNVGEVAAGKPQLKSAGQSFLAAGRPVFAIQRPAQSVAGR
ncbi:AAA family ATPase [Planctomicrobium piriforme]|uniref:Uncharacterized protein n=1 Tax=Planctomicrobium piriforme TaxID=1576369 RepID=A0A1I3MZD2_9PLAN|nr:hypothetical protein [Planctomicrobium piriforme]SFJ02110.1 hypothetical protein SAMN05421753_114150 [Planctomicrobium piriforme]